MNSSFLTLFCLIFICHCRTEEVFVNYDKVFFMKKKSNYSFFFKFFKLPNFQIQTYTAAVVELNPISIGDNFENVGAVTEQVIKIIESDQLYSVDILLFPEGIFNRPNTASYMPTTNTSYCDDENVDTVLRKISCAIRKAKKYVAINLYVKVSCLEDDQNFCANTNDNTNLYNMAVVFNRIGDVIAR